MCKKKENLCHFQIILFSSWEDLSLSRVLLTQGLLAAVAMGADPSPDARSCCTSDLCCAQLLPQSSHEVVRRMGLPFSRTAARPKCLCVCPSAAFEAETFTGAVSAASRGALAFVLALRFLRSWKTAQPNHLAMATSFSSRRMSLWS